MAKSMLTDFFRGEVSDKIDVEGLRYCVVVTADEPTAAATDNNDDIAAKPVLRLRVYTIRTQRSGQKLPRVELEEHGPRMDFRLGRTQEPDDAMLKEAMRRARTGEERTKKNVSTDIMGDKIGRIHTGKLDLSELQTRKMKGLKRERDPHLNDDGEGAGAGADEEATVVEEEQQPRRKRKVAA
jgi:ribosome production factor 2